MTAMNFVNAVHDIEFLFKDECIRNGNSNDFENINTAESNNEHEEANEPNKNLPSLPANNDNNDDNDNDDNDITLFFPKSKKEIAAEKRKIAAEKRKIAAENRKIDFEKRIKVSYDKQPEAVRPSSSRSVQPSKFLDQVAALPNKRKSNRNSESPQTAAKETKSYVKSVKGKSGRTVAEPVITKNKNSTKATTATIVEEKPTRKKTTTNKVSTKIGTTTVVVNTSSPALSQDSVNSKKKLKAELAEMSKKYSILNQQFESMKQQQSKVNPTVEVVEQTPAASMSTLSSQEQQHHHAVFNESRHQSSYNYPDFLSPPKHLSTYHDNKFQSKHMYEYTAGPSGTTSSSFKSAATSIATPDDSYMGYQMFLEKQQRLEQEQKFQLFLKSQQEEENLKFQRDQKNYLSYLLSQKMEQEEQTEKNYIQRIQKEISYIQQAPQRSMNSFMTTSSQEIQKGSSSSEVEVALALRLLKKNF
jgi:hypothetical protein